MKEKQIEMERWDIARILSQNFHINGEGWDDSDFEWAAHCLQVEGYRKQSDGEDTNVPTKWISVEDMLPTDQKEVLCYYGFDRGDGDLGMMFIGTLCYFCFDKNPHWQHAEHNLVVTHWMPLPDAPKKGE